MARDLEILFEDNHLLVINKPAILATMGAAPGKPSLIELAKEYIGEKYDKPGKVYLGVVSRLDAFVTGVIVVARTSKAAARLSQQFREKSAEKTYFAIVPDRGEIADQGQLENWLVLVDSSLSFMKQMTREGSLNSITIPRQAPLSRLKSSTSQDRTM